MSCFAQQLFEIIRYIIMQIHEKQQILTSDNLDIGILAHVNGESITLNGYLFKYYH